MLYSLRDISIVPAVLTSIKSRSECNPFRKSIEGKEGYYPLIASPMDSVMDDQNWGCYWDNKISCVIPRSIPESIRSLPISDEEKYEVWFKKRRELCTKVFCAFGLNEAKWFLENSLEGDPNEPLSLYILIDIANGSMQEEIEVGKALKRKFGDKLSLMGGNIGNPQTYLLYDQAGFDFLRAGIGSGQGCLGGDMDILLSDGTTKKMRDLVVGDLVKTVVGDKEVLETCATSSEEEMITINNSLVCTSNHKIFVINKKDKDLVTQDNILSLGYYVEAGEIDENKHMLVKLYDN